jgi:hypothetical protein
VLAHHFHHHRAERGAGQRIRRRTQRVFRMRHAQNQKLRRIDSELEQPRRRDLAEFETGKILPYPENRFALRHARGKTRDESRGRRFVTGRRIHLMQRAFQ